MKANLVSATTAAHHVFSRIDLSQNGISTMVMTTLDGQEIAIYDPGQKFSAARLSAMTSSLIAIARSIGKEVDFDGCDRLMLETPTGKIIFRPVGHKYPYLLCIVVNQDAILGHTIWTVDKIVSNFIQQLILNH
ncbi:roadblock/LC7 domain-containing protein [Collimonas sp.]|jgi:predicted regulator of Ras-like GTPase activity (Roadblock/LC7/MglB family)|uniref:roadblock/LC7 domain-containing protein n=1 Tax=Collimonas sp. TaxID=1963772 RepID=UPI002CD0A822|nr:roadblock/LC7 domain-containing protein [Collimonas sp.]HWX01095.1 roadblock/LC7 domain-containing protein [Collimonas sp.]